VPTARVRMPSSDPFTDGSFAATKPRIQSLFNALTRTYWVVFLAAVAQDTEDSASDAAFDNEPPHGEAPIPDACNRTFTRGLGDHVVTESPHDRRGSTVAGRGPHAPGNKVGGPRRAAHLDEFGR
jgi:hypothetical protein